MYSRRRFKLEFLRAPIRATTWKRPAKREGKLRKLTNVGRLKHFQKEICVVRSHDFICFVKGEEERLKLSSACLFLSSSPFSPVNSFLSFFFFDGFSCLFVPSLFLFPLLSPSSPLLTFPVGNVRLPQKETQPRHSQGWQLTLTVSLFMEAENYTVTFPAFLLEISNRRGLSIQDRDPGGIETGCFCNHFLSHHFLQVD